LEGVSAVAVWDFGQNIAGFVKVQVLDNPALPFQSGDTLILQHSEILNATTNTIVRMNLGLAKAEDRYTFASAHASSPSYRPTFTYHGFRYCQVCYLPAEQGVARGAPPFSSSSSEFASVVGHANPLPASLNVTALWVHTAAETTGLMGLSSDALTRVVAAVVASQRSNLMSIPTDCPNRDERLGWLGDAAVGSCC